MICNSRFFLFKTSISLIFLLFLPSLVWASFALPIAGHFYVEGSGGWNLLAPRHSNPKIRYDNGNITDAYPLHRHEIDSGIFSISGGYEVEGSNYIPNVGLDLGVYTTTNPKFRGKLVESVVGDPTTALYNYRFRVRSTRLMVNALFTWQLWCDYFPFFNVGIGPSWNRLSDYTEKTIDPNGFVALPPFRSKTRVNFAYQVGAGLGYAVKWCNAYVDLRGDRISVGYRYANLGHASFGTRGVDYPFSLNLDKLRSHEVYLAYIHLF